MGKPEASPSQLSYLRSMALHNAKLYDMRHPKGVWNPKLIGDFTLSNERQNFSTVTARTASLMIERGWIEPVHDKSHSTPFWAITKAGRVVVNNAWKYAHRKE